MSTFTVAKPEEAFLSEHDFTAVSFWIISIAMIAATVFFDVSQQSAYLVLTNALQMHIVQENVRGRSC